MIYLSEFYFPSQNSEANYLAESPRAKMTCYASVSYTHLTTDKDAVHNVIKCLNQHRNHHRY